MAESRSAQANIERAAGFVDRQIAMKTKDTFMHAGVELLSLCLLLSGFAAWAGEGSAEVKIDKITIAVTDAKLKETASFYSKTFGAQLKSFEVQGKTLYSGSLGGLELMLCPKDLAGVKADQNTVQLRFIVK